MRASYAPYFLQNKEISKDKYASPEISSVIRCWIKLAYDIKHPTQHLSSPPPRATQHP